MTTMSASQARAALPDILDRVAAGEEVTITRHGEVVAIVLRPDAVRVRRADVALASAERLHGILDAARAKRLDEAPPLSRRRADELVADVRATRAAR
jgi:antitoxin (DNA-binding transcriptional repressor) of toxin-antitoxin stability system